MSRHRVPKQVVAALLVMAATMLTVVATVSAAGAQAGPQPKPLRGADGKPIPGEFTLTMFVGQSSSFTMSRDLLTNVISGPTSSNPAVADAAVTNGRGDRDVSDTVTVRCLTAGTAIIRLAVEQWYLNFFGHPQQRRPGQVGHWTEGDLTIHVTCKSRPPVTTTTAPGKP